MNLNTIFNNNHIATVASSFGGSTTSTPFAKHKSINKYKMIVATDFGFNKHAGYHLVQRLQKNLQEQQFIEQHGVDRTCSNNDNGTTCPSSVETPIHSAISSLYSLNNDMHSPTAVLLSKLLNHYVNNVSGSKTNRGDGASISTNIPIEYMLSHMETSIIMDILTPFSIESSKEDDNTTIATHHLHDISALLIESFRHELYVNLMRDLFGDNDKRSSINSRYNHNKNHRSINRNSADSSNNIIMCTNKRHYYHKLLYPNYKPRSGDTRELEINIGDIDNDFDIFVMIYQACKDLYVIISKQLKKLRRFIQVYIRRDKDMMETSTITTDPIDSFFIGKGLRLYDIYFDNKHHERLR